MRNLEGLKGCRKNVKHALYFSHLFVFAHNFGWHSIISNSDADGLKSISQILHRLQCTCTRSVHSLSIDWKSGKVITNCTQNSAKGTGGVWGVWSMWPQEQHTLDPPFLRCNFVWKKLPMIYLMVSHKKGMTMWSVVLLEFTPCTSSWWSIHKNKAWILWSTKAVYQKEITHC